MSETISAAVKAKTVYAVAGIALVVISLLENIPNQGYWIAGIVLFTVLFGAYDLTQQG